MNKLDFLSGAPKTFIFEKTSNKTNLGGVFTFIYLIIVFLISFAYIYDYIVNDKYIVSYKYEHNHFGNPVEIERDIEKRYNNSNLNPEIVIAFNLNGVEDTGNFELITVNNTNTKPYEYIKFNEPYKTKVYDFFFMLLYKCEDFEEGDTECHISEQDLPNLDTDIPTLNLLYSGYKLDHQNAESPLKEDIILESFPFILETKMNFVFLSWKTIKYNEDKGIMKIFGNSSEIYGGEFINSENIRIDKGPLIEAYLENGLLPLLVLTVSENELNNYYDIYTRKKIGIFDPIANICSLSIAIYNGLTLVFCKIYSNSFDNYKIIDKILSKKYNEKFTKKDNTNNKNRNSINDNEIDKIEDEENKIDDYNNKNKKEEKLLENNEEDKVKIEENDENENILPKLRFYQYLFNNIYKKNCCNSNNQEIISTCNEIISKYFSIENIIYNQLLLDNLFTDYIWNEPKLKNIENNKLVNDLNLLLLNK